MCESDTQGLGYISNGCPCASELDYENLPGVATHLKWAQKASGTDQKTAMQEMRIGGRAVGIIHVVPPEKAEETK